MAMTSYERVKRWRERHRDEWLAQAKGYREKHPDVVKAIRKRYYERKRVGDCQVSIDNEKSQKPPKFTDNTEISSFLKALQKTRNSK